MALINNRALAGFTGSQSLSRLHSNLVNRTTFTIACWMKRSTISSSQTFAGFGSSAGPANDIALSFQPGNTIIFQFWNASQAVVGTMASNETIADTTTWHHFCCTIDTTAANAADRNRMYIDGVEVTYSQKLTIPQNQVMMSGTTFYWGRLGYSAVNFYRGIMDECFFVEGRALDPSYFISGTPPSPIGPIDFPTGSSNFGAAGSWLRFEDATSTTTLGNDSSTLGNNWTLSGFTTANSTTDAPQPIAPPVVISLVGVGSMTVKALRQARSAAITLAGQGALAATANVVRRPAVLLSGQGTLTVQSHVIARTAAVLSGQSSLSVLAQVISPGSVAFFGQGRLTVSPPRVIRPTAAILAGVGNLNLAATVNPGRKDLTATPLATQTPKLGSPYVGVILGAGIAVEGADLRVSALVDQPDEFRISVNTLVAQGLPTASPIIASPIITPTGIEALRAPLLTTEAPEIGAPSLLAHSILSAFGLKVDVPTLGVPIFSGPGLVEAFGALGVLTNRPGIGRPSMGVIQAYKPITSQPIVYPQKPVLGPPYPDHHIRRSGDDYVQPLLDLLPQGRAWPREPETTLYRTIAGLAQIYGLVDKRAADLLEIEADARLTIEMLVDWERNWGLPDPCFFGEPQTVALRRKMLLLKMTLMGGQARAFFIAVAKLLGYDITISEFSPFMCGVSHVGDTRELDTTDNLFSDFASFGP